MPIVLNSFKLFFREFLNGIYVIHRISVAYIHVLGINVFGCGGIIDGQPMYTSVITFQLRFLSPFFHL